VTFVQLANPNDLRQAQQTYQAYFDFLTFRSGPPQADFADRLKALMLPVDDTPYFCPYQSIVNIVSELRGKGQYVRMDSLSLLKWRPDRNIISPAVNPIALSVELQSLSIKLELVDATTGKVLKEQQRSIAPSPTLVYLSDTRQWAVQSDPGGYCSAAEEFLK
jgi:hypothetical protein